MVAIRILVVEDFSPFSDFINSTLEKRPDLQIICNAVDGLEAVRRVEELEPDLILLDIGLPTLNGIEAARQIRQHTAKSKIIFVSQETSPDVVEEALRVGGCGYVVKTRAGTDLVPAVEAALQGRQFVSDGLSDLQ